MWQRRTTTNNVRRSQLSLYSFWRLKPKQNLLLGHGNLSYGQNLNLYLTWQSVEIQWIEGGIWKLHCASCVTTQVNIIQYIIYSYLFIIHFMICDSLLVDLKANSNLLVASDHRQRIKTGFLPGHVQRRVRLVPSASIGPNSGDPGLPNNFRGYILENHG